MGFIYGLIWSMEVWYGCNKIWFPLPSGSFHMIKACCFQMRSMDFYFNSGCMLGHEESLLKLLIDEIIAVRHILVFVICFYWFFIQWSVKLRCMQIKTNLKLVNHTTNRFINHNGLCKKILHMVFTNKITGQLRSDCKSHKPR